MDLFEAILTRKSSRSYEQKQIPQEALAKIVEAGQWPPNAGPYHLSVIQNPELIQKINDLAAEGMRNSGDEFLMSRIALPGYQPLYGAPTLILLAAPAENNLSGMNVSLAAENMLLAATALGLDSCFLFTPSLAFAGDNSGKLKAVAQIPEDYTVYCGVIIGYAAEVAFSPPVREKKGTVSHIK